MNKINKYNEFLNNEELIIKQMIESGENTPFSDLIAISERQEYKDVISLGKKIIPYLLERNCLIWDIALKQLTGKGLDSLKYKSSERQKYWKNWAKENGY